MDISGSIVVTKCITIACGGSMPMYFSEFADITAERTSENIMVICKILRGKAVVAIAERQHSANEGAIFLMSSTNIYTFTASESLKACLIVFDRRIFNNSYAYPLGREAISPISSMADECEIVNPDASFYPKITGIVDEIWEEASKKDTASPLMSVSLLWQFAAVLKREKLNRGDETRSLREHRNRERLAPVIDYIFKEYDKRITLTDLAKMVNMSVPNFSSVFKETIGVSPMEYLTRLRLQNAADMLQNSDKKIIDIAEECGFFSISNFIKAFHNGMNMSPSQYRKKSTVLVQTGS